MCGLPTHFYSLYLLIRKQTHTEGVWLSSVTCPVIVGLIFVLSIRYIGRKRMKKEPFGLLPDATMLNWVPYSYWTLGYVINLKGARKLVSAKPLQKMVALDEFLPIMYNKHPE